VCENVSVASPTLGVASVAALQQGKPGQCPGKKAFALVVALPKLSRGKKFQSDNMTKLNLPLIVFKVNK